MIGAEAKAAVPEMIEYAKRAGGASEHENAVFWLEKIQAGASAELRR